MLRTERALLFESRKPRSYHRILDHSPAGETGTMPAPKAQTRPESLRQKDLRAVGRYSACIARLAVAGSTLESGS